MAVAQFHGPVTSEVRELSAGIDTAVFSFDGTLLPNLVEVLEEAKEWARAFGKDAPLTIGSTEFLVRPGSLKLMRFRLDHGYGVMGVSDRPSLPILRWQPRGAFLHAVGAAGARDWLRDCFAGVALVGPDQIARVDLYADFQGLWFGPGDIDNFVTRATRDATRRMGGQFTGYEFGGRSRGGMNARIYQKDIEIELKHGDYWRELWGTRFIPGAPVWRIEFEFHRDVLREFGVSDLASVETLLPRLWAYATTKWLSLREPRSDQTRSRWPCDPRWMHVVAANHGWDYVPLERVREIQRGRGLHEDLPYALGYLERIAAHRGTADLGEALDYVRQHGPDYLKAKGTDFERESRAKRIRMGVV